MKGRVPVRRYSHITWRIAVAVVLCVPLCGQVPQTGAETVRPAHGRPFFMPQRERQRILKLIDSAPWAKAEYTRIRAEADKGNGFWAGFLYALHHDERYLDACRKYLIRTCGPKAYAVRTYTKRLAEPNHFKAGQPHLGDVYYGLSFEPLVVYDWVYRGLSQADRRLIEAGITTIGRYRMRAMDRWTQTPNLVFKPTFMAAMAGLTTQDEQLMQWGLFRTKPHGARLGGYFRVLDVMLRDGGPWLEAPIYPVAHRDLWCMAVMSRYGNLYDGRDWFAMKTRRGDSPAGLMQYYIDTAWPIEWPGQGDGQIRVATYGDGATSPGGDLFLVNPAGAGLNMERALIAAYNASGTPVLVPFVGMIQGYTPDLWNRRPLPAGMGLPPAPSKVWPNYGLAMLRSDESPAYWTGGKAIAVFQLMSQGYGHDHRDKFAIMLHGAGRLMYPDYNAIQYESSSIGWTRHTCSHNTLLVDEQDTANARPTAIRHVFSPEMKYLATSASGVFEGVDQTRVLMLTGEYLLDVFHARSALPHTYDYMLHCFGQCRSLGGQYRPAPDLTPRYWVIEDKHEMTTDRPWAVEFVHRDKPGSRGGKYGPEWYDHTARVRVSMAAADGTQVVRGVWGKRYAEMVSAKHRGKKRLDELSSLVVRRAGLPAAVFAAVHEPYANRDKPHVRGVTVLAQTAEAVLVRVDADSFTDYAAVSFGPQTGGALHTLSTDRTAVRFSDYAYLRVGLDGRIVARGKARGWRVPGAGGPAVVNGTRVTAAQLTGALADAETRPTPPLPLPVRCPLKITAEPSSLRVWTRDRKPIHFVVRNILDRSVSGRIEFDLPKGFSTQPVGAAFGPLKPGQVGRVPVTFAVSDPRSGKHTIAYRIVYRTSDAAREIRTLARPLLAYAGPTVESVYQFPKPPVYRVVTSHYTTATRMSDGAPVYLADDADEIRLDGQPLFLLSAGDDEPVELLTAKPKTGGVWVGRSPANLVAEASGRHEKRYVGSRWQAVFMVNRIIFRMDPGWTQVEKVRFTLPGQWRCKGGKPRWKRVVAVDAQGRQHEAAPGDHVTVSAALLEFPGSRLHLAFQFSPPVPVTFRGAGMAFDLGALKREKWQVGFCEADQFDRWRGKR